MKLPILASLSGLAGLFTTAHAFGAGNIPSDSSIEGKNFRHGDIEDVLAQIVISHRGGKTRKFDGLDIKRVYFGNWLRDFSQAVDVGTLSLGLNADTVRAIIWLVSMSEFGYGTGEFEVTEERLGVYRAEEHMDNPKGYPEDAQQYDRRLRGPVDPRELEIDPKTGMKNYIANEDGDWATSSEYVREQLLRSIKLGRRYIKGGYKKHSLQHESLRLLGGALHTLEDFTAHTNYLELVLRDMGYKDVYAHVGNQTRIKLAGKKVFPVVTGTFGGLDFLHSLLGGAHDSLSESGFTEASANFEKKKKSGSNTSEFLKSILRKLPIKLPDIPDAHGGFRDMTGADLADHLDELQHNVEEYVVHQRDHDGNDKDCTNCGQTKKKPEGSEGGSGNMQKQGQHPFVLVDQPPFKNTPGGTNISKVHNNDPNYISLESYLDNLDVDAVIRAVYPLLEFKDSVMSSLESFFGDTESSTALGMMASSISDALASFTNSIINPIINPILEAVTEILHASVTLLSYHDDQIDVWINPKSTDPTHSRLSKDHFAAYLNEPAGLVAAEVVKYVVPFVVEAWEDPSIDPQTVVDEALQTFHHPALANTKLHRIMRAEVDRWIQTFSDEEREHILEGLTSRGVLHGHNNAEHLDVNNVTYEDSFDHTGSEEKASTFLDYIDYFGFFNQQGSGRGSGSMKREHKEDAEDIANDMDAEGAEDSEKHHQDHADTAQKKAKDNAKKDEAKHNQKPKPKKAKKSKGKSKQKSPFHDHAHHVENHPDKAKQQAAEEAASAHDEEGSARRKPQQP